MSRRRPDRTPVALGGLALVLVACLAAVPARAQNAAQPAATPKGTASPSPAPPATAPSTGVRVVEWVVFLVDPNVPLANDAAAFRSTLPGFVRGRRGQATADLLNDPSPVGVIRLTAPAAGGDATAKGETYDVLLRAPGGRFLASWPAGKPRSERQLWEKLALSDAPVRPESVETGHWFEQLRRGAGAWLRGGERSERFLLYDVQCPVGVPLRIRASQAKGAATRPATTAPSGDAYEVANASAASLRGLQLYKPEGDGWRAGVAEDLKPSKNAKPPAKPDMGPAQPGPAPVATGPAADLIKELFIEVTRVGRGNAPMPQPVPVPTPTPATQPAADLAPDDWVAITLSAGGAVPADVALAPWGDRLTRAGLGDADRDAILAILRRHAVDPDQLTAVYQIDPAELDRVLPLEVVPSPASVVRVGLAVVRNVDPDAGSRVAKLIAELGSDSWEKREAAEQALVKLGVGARPKLQEALNGKDVEVVYRVERLLAKSEGRPQP